MIKRCVLYISLLFLSFSAVVAETPIDKGNWIIDGSAGLTLGGGDMYEDYTRISIQPSLQYFMTKGLAVGPILGFSYSKRSDNKTYVYAIGPTVAYYFGSGETKLIPFMRSSARFAWQKDKYRGIVGYGMYYEETTDSRGTIVSASCGFANLISKNIAITIATGFTYEHYTNGRYTTDGHYIGLNLGVMAFVM
jgi:hypothetical protein